MSTEGVPPDGSGLSLEDGRQPPSPRDSRNDGSDGSREKCVRCGEATDAVRVPRCSPDAHADLWAYCFKCAQEGNMLPDVPEAKQRIFYAEQPGRPWEINFYGKEHRRFLLSQAARDDIYFKASEKAAKEAEDWRARLQVKSLRAMAVKLAAYINADNEGRRAEALMKRVRWQDVLTERSIDRASKHLASLMAASQAASRQPATQQPASYPATQQLSQAP